MTTDEVLDRISRKIVDDNERGRFRLGVYGWSTLLAFAQAWLRRQEDAADRPVAEIPSLTEAQLASLQHLYNGGDIEAVHTATFAALQRKGMIDTDGKLTDAGAKAALEQ